MRAPSRAYTMGMTASPSAELAALKKELRLHVIVLGAMLSLMWMVEISDAVFWGGQLDAHGIRPRTAEGLLGILFAPFLHVGFVHLVSNTLPFLVMGWLVLARETWHFGVVTVVTMVVGGFGTWLVGAADSVHIGASGVVFGYLGYLLLAGWYDRSVGSIVVSILVFVFYGALLLGVLPGEEGISWEGHLFGLLAGALCARFIARRRDD